MTESTMPSPFIPLSPPTTAAASTPARRPRKTASSAPSAASERPRAPKKPRKPKATAQREHVDGPREIAAAATTELMRRAKKPRAAKNVAPKAATGKLGINEIVSATVGLKADEAKLLLAIVSKLGDLNKSGKVKVVAALGKLFG